MVETSLKKLVHLFTTVLPENSEAAAHIMSQPPNKSWIFITCKLHVKAKKMIQSHLLSILQVSVLLTMFLSSASVILLRA